MVCPYPSSPFCFWRRCATRSSGPRGDVALHFRARSNLCVSNRFLLKYASRDEVELLGRGNGGIVEIRNNIAQYTEKSPLYGFLRYRRRNVIIKYLPEDCSRLIQGKLYDPPFLDTLSLASTRAHLAPFLQHE